MRYTYTCYEDIAEQDETFRETLGYDDHSTFRLCRCSTESTAQGLEWLNVPQGWYIEPDQVDGGAATMWATYLCLRPVPGSLMSLRAIVMAWECGFYDRIGVSSVVVPRQSKGKTHLTS